MAIHHAQDQIILALRATDEVVAALYWVAERQEKARPSPDSVGSITSRYSGNDPTLLSRRGGTRHSGGSRRGARGAVLIFRPSRGPKSRKNSFGGHPPPPPPPLFFLSKGLDNRGPPLISRSGFGTVDRPKKTEEIEPIESVQNVAWDRSLVDVLSIAKHEQLSWRKRNIDSKEFHCHIYRPTIFQTTCTSTEPFQSPRWNALVLSFSGVPQETTTPHCQLLGNLINDDGDGNENVLFCTFLCRHPATTRREMA